MFSYVGGKSRQAKWISPFIPQTKRYVEVFGGAMWVYINGNIDCQEAIYNDVIPFLVNVFDCFRFPDRMLDAMVKYEPKNKELFLSLLEEFKDPNRPVGWGFDEAAKYVYCITHSFSGLLAGYSDQSKQKHSKYVAVMNRLQKPEVRQKLEKMKAVNMSFDEILKKYDSSDTYFYLDPPYYGKENYYKFHGFTKEHHEKLAYMLKNEVKAKWCLSYYYFDDLEKWFPKDEYVWEMKEYNRCASAKAGKSTLKTGKGEELLVMNYDINKIDEDFFE